MVAIRSLIVPTSEYLVVLPMTTTGELRVDAHRVSRSRRHRQGVQGGLGRGGHVGWVESVPPTLAGAVATIVVATAI
jgi:hypothetical protein